MEALSNSPNCSVGIKLSEMCKKSCEQLNYVIVSSLSDIEQRLLFIRTGASSLFNICSDHVEKYITKYTFRTNQKFCCDPLAVHKKRATCEAVIDIDLSDHIHTLSGMRLVPGKKLCKHCEVKLKEGYFVSPENDMREPSPKGSEILTTKSNTLSIDRHDIEDFSPSGVALPEFGFREYYPAEQNIPTQTIMSSSTGSSSGP